MRWHLQKHVGPALARAVQRRDSRLADNLLDHVEYLHEVTLERLERFRDKDDDNGETLRAVREDRGNIELAAKLLGKLQPEAAAPASFTFEHLQVLYLELKEQGAIT